MSDEERQKLERMGLLYKPKEGPTPKELFIDELLRKIKMDEDLPK